MCYLLFLLFFRAKCPKPALPDSVRRKMGLKPRKERKRDVRLGRTNQPDAHANAGAGVLKARESKDGNYSAGCQKNFLRRGSGKCMSSRASKLAQNQLNVRKRTSSSSTIHHIIETPKQKQAPQRKQRQEESGRNEPTSEEARRVELRNQRAVAARMRQLNK